ncbi:polyprotein [Elysia marginata]|uniref:Polyprotein n=1 Tax=Elysia marginata TaxID=1093978 RepID=A0AAV4I772_9GAST|nr:polyprotein [Elysia marginata]
MPRHPVGPTHHLDLPDDATIVSAEDLDIPVVPNILLAIRAHSTEVITMCSNTDESLGINSVTWDNVRVATSSDESMKKLLKLVGNGFPDAKDAMPQDLRNLYQYRDKLTSFDGVVLYMTE